MVGENVGMFFLFGTKKTTNNELVPGTTSSIQFQPSVASQSFTPSKVNLKKTEQHHTHTHTLRPFFVRDILQHCGMLRHCLTPAPPTKKCPRLRIPTNGITKVTIKVRRHRSTLGSREASETQGEDRNGSPFWKEFWCSYSYLDIFKTHLSL